MFASMESYTSLMSLSYFLPLTPGAKMSFALAPGEQSSCVFPVRLAAGAKEIAVGAVLKGSDLAPIGTLVRGR